MEHDILNAPSCILTNKRPRRRGVPVHVVFNVTVYRSCHVGADAAADTQSGPFHSDDYEDARQRKAVQLMHFDM